MKALKELADWAYITFAPKGIYSKPAYSIEKSRMDLIISILKKYDAKTFLDVGCGEGIYLIKMRAHYKLLIGIDFCRAALLDIKKTARSSGNVECILADGHKLPIKDNSIDVVLSSEVLEHTKNPMKVIGQISDICKKYAVITVPIEIGEDVRTTVDLKNFDDNVLKCQLQNLVEKTKTSHIYQFSFHFFERLLRNNSELEIIDKRGSAFTFVGSGDLRKVVCKWKLLNEFWKFIEIKLLSPVLIFRANYRILGNLFGVFVLKRKSIESEDGR